jgi:hypothetical protein
MVDSEITRGFPYRGGDGVGVKAEDVGHWNIIMNKNKTLPTSTIQEKASAEYECITIGGRVLLCCVVLC